MSKEILINNNGFETRVALIDGGLASEFWLERQQQSSIVGNIYKGRVQKVLPGLQAAFIDIGLAKSAFIHVSDFAEIERDVDKSQDVISTLLHEGQMLVVQVYKDQIGSKGARVTTQVSIPSRYLVMMPNASELLAISSRIDDVTERERLLTLMKEINEGNEDFGLIARTNAEQMQKALLEHDWQFLKRLWRKVAERIENQKTPSLIYSEFSLAKRVVRDHITENLTQITVDSYDIHLKVKQFVSDFAYEWPGEVHWYQGSRPLFDQFNAEDEIERILSKKVDLKSGGNLVFDQNEAMTTVDVNTGQYVGFKSLEDTAFKTNLEAAQVIARQLRLRNIGGIIVIDFIDMADVMHQQQVQQTLEEYLSLDSARTNVLGFTALNLMEVTRKRTTENIRDVVCEPCNKCHGSGYIQTIESNTFKLFREISRSVKQFKASKIMVIAAPNLVEYIIDEHSETLSEMEENLNKRITLQAEESYGRDQYDVVLL